MPRFDPATELRKALDEAPPRRKAATFHFFRIDHAADLRGIDLKELAREIGESEKRATEIR